MKRSERRTDHCRARATCMTIPKWRFCLVMFLLLTSASLLFDCLVKMKPPLHALVALTLRDSVFPAVIVAAIILFNAWLWFAPSAQVAKTLKKIFGPIFGYFGQDDDDSQRR